MLLTNDTKPRIMTKDSQIYLKIARVIRGISRTGSRGENPGVPPHRGDGGGGQRVRIAHVMRLQ